MWSEKNKLKWFFQDKTDKYVIGAPPNSPLLIVVISYLMTLIFESGPWNQLFAAVQHGAIFLWSYLEIRYGESPFRRVLGAIIMVVFLYGATASSK